MANKTLTRIQHYKIAKWVENNSDTLKGKRLDAVTRQIKKEFGLKVAVSTLRTLFREFKIPYTGQKDSPGPLASMKSFAKNRSRIMAIILKSFMEEVGYENQDHREALDMIIKNKAISESELKGDLAPDVAPESSQQTTLFESQPAGSAG